LPLLDTDSTRNGMLEGLTPSEPVFPYDADIVPIYPERLPRAVRNWCFVSITVNLVTLAVGTFVFRNLGPTLLFVMWTLLGPLNLLFFW